MEVSTVTEIVSNVGFPIACAIVLGYFVFIIYKRSVEREDMLMSEIKENRAINAKAIETITKYADRLDNIERDVSDIKVDVIKISDKISE